jgi:hypothetical protein
LEETAVDESQNWFKKGMAIKKLGSYLHISQMKMLLASLRRGWMKEDARVGSPRFARK